MPLRENRLTWAGSPLACSESGLIRHDIEEEVALFGTWLYLTHSVINSLREFIVLLGVTVSFSFLCPFSKRKARVSGAVFISMTLSAASPAAWKSSRPWREDPLLARARHVDVFARGEREKIFLWRSCSTEGILYRGAGEWPVGRMQIQILYVAWQSARPVCWPWRWKLAAWSPVRGFSLSLGMDVSITPLCSDVSRPFTLGLPWWRLPARHACVCLWLINPPCTHVHTHTVKSPLAHQQPPVSLSLTNTHISRRRLFHSRYFSFDRMKLLLVEIWSE